MLLDKEVKIEDESEDETNPVDSVEDDEDDQENEVYDSQDEIDDDEQEDEGEENGVEVKQEEDEESEEDIVEEVDLSDVDDDEEQSMDIEVKEEEESEEEGEGEDLATELAQYQNTQEYIEEQKTQMASLCLAILESPEEHVRIFFHAEIIHFPIFPFLFLFADKRFEGLIGYG